MIAEEIQNALNVQINEEYCSWYFYRSAAAYCREKNLTGCSKWLRRRSEEKLDQANRLTDYLLERRGRLEAKPINFLDGRWESLDGVLDTALERERHLGESVADLMDLSLKQRDHATHDLLETFATDQTGAEANVELARDRLKMVDGEPAGLFMFDRDLG